MQIPKKNQPPDHGFKRTLLNSKNSSRWGYVLIFFPILFLAGVLFRHYLRLDFQLLTFFYDWVANRAPDSDNHWLSWLIRIVLLVGPMVALAVNLAAITHFSVDRSQKEALLTFKWRSRNMWIIAASLFVLMVFLSYLFIENILNPH